MDKSKSRGEPKRWRGLVESVEPSVEVVAGELHSNGRAICS
jgi:hypothetical protein